jgi:hypothetical protein
MPGCGLLGFRAGCSPVLVPRLLLFPQESFYGAAEELDLPFVREAEKAGPAWETRL